MEKQRFYIVGMTCSGCERTLERAVSNLDGVHAVRSDHQKGQLDAEFSQPCTHDQIVSAVRKAGYEVTNRSRRRSDALYLLIILLGAM